MNEKQVWKDIEGLSHYQVSNLGRVKSLKHNKEKILKHHVYKESYPSIRISCGGGRQKSIKIHQCVARAFLNHKPNGLKKVINHKDGNKLNNNVNNLEIVSHRENSSTCYRKDRDKLTSSFVGVSWNNQYKKWLSQITINGESVYLGVFDNEVDASNAYQEALNNIDNPTFREQEKSLI